MTEIENKALYIAEQCRKAGMTLAGAAGVLANVEAESAFSSINVQDTFNRALGISDEEFVRRVDTGDTALFMTRDLGFGLVQWTAQDRKEKFLSHFRKLGVSIGDFRTQVDYMILDMRTFWNKTPWNTCTSSNNPFQCGYDMCKHYEICADLENASNYRGGLAQTWYNFLTQHQGERETVPTGVAIPTSGSVPAASVGVEAAPVGEPVIVPATESFPPRMIDNVHCEGWPEIWLAQALLKCRAYNVTLDGIFGKHMTEKVKEFQTHQKLDADGVIGKKTWKALGIDM